MSERENDPLVSVIIPCYNVSGTILETLQSVFSQTYKNIEIVVVNDGSTDRPADIIMPLLTEHKLIIYHEQENRGLPATRNTGFLLSHGQFLVFLDGDDLLHEDFVSQCLKQFFETPDTHLVYTDTMLFEAENGILKLPQYSYKAMLMKNCITATAMIPRNYFEQVGMYDESLNFNEDWELWIRYLYAFPNVKKIKKSLFYYRRRLSENSMTDFNDRQNVSDRAALYIYNKHYEKYIENGYNIAFIMSLIFREKKNYNKWYRRLFYALFKPKKHQKKISQLP